MSKQSKELSIDWNRASTYRPFLRVAVLGAGTMGSQIAAHLANTGVRVLLLDIAPTEGDDKNAIVRSSFGRARKLKPSPFFTGTTATRIELGNFDDDFDRLADVDWVIEAVVERREIKQSVMKRIESVVGPDAVVSSNTSGIPIREVVSECQPDFRKRFLGTHFFNPPRYLPLLEVIPTSDTAWEVVERVAGFARVHLGKGVVIANDSPYFIGNRIGIFAMMVAMRERLEEGFTIEEVDALTGALVGRPRSATFRTADVVGLDVMKAVIENLYDAIPDDESRDVFKLPDELAVLVEAGALGAKTRAGFYRKEGKEIKSFDPRTGEYRSASPLNLPDLEDIHSAGSLPERLRALFNADSRAGAFFRRTTIELLSYAARKIPEITDSPENVDKAIRWGFGWKLGPFQIWDVLGFERVRQAMLEAGLLLPDWISDVAASNAGSFYRDDSVFIPAHGTYERDIPPADETSLPSIRTRSGGEIWGNQESGLIDMGEGVALLEFRSKANTLGQRVIEGMMEAIDRVESDRNLRGLVIGNDGANFSVGANLGEVAMTLLAGKFDDIEKSVDRFQQAMQRVRYAEKPVVVAVHQRVLGGAAEMTMACTNPVAAAESYIGLVELGVGLVPAGTGTMRLAQRAAAESPNGYPNEIQAALAKYFEQIAMARVSVSAREAQEMGYLSRFAAVVMRAERRLHVAAKEVIRLSEEGYLPPCRGQQFKVLGAQGKAALETMALQFQQGHFISDYDLLLARQLAHILSGGDLSGPETVSEQYVLDLEREAFMRLLGEVKTQERIQYLLENNKPLRN